MIITIVVVKQSKIKFNWAKELLFSPLITTYREGGFKRKRILGNTVYHQYPSQESLN